MNYKVAILPILICLLSSCSFQHRTNKASSEAPSVNSADSVNETETPIFPKEYQVRYEKPINGFTVTALIEAYEEDDSGPAVLTFKKSDVSFTVLVLPFSKEGFSLKNYYDTHEEILLQYVPKPKGVMLYDKEPFCFSDIDYDGVDEIIVLDSKGGAHGVSSYFVYEQDGSLRQDGPFEILFDEHAEFDAKNKTITRYYYEDGASERTVLIYKHEKDGQFVLINDK